MKAFMIYAISLYDWDNIEVGREYFLDRHERNERLKIVAAHKAEAFQFRLSKSTAWKLNNHVIGREKKKIAELRSEVENLKIKLKAKIQLLIDYE